MKAFSDDFWFTAFTDDDLEFLRQCDEHDEQEETEKNEDIIFHALSVTA